MNMNMVSVKQLREDFASVKRSIDNGEHIILIYRSRPLAEIRPYSNPTKSEDMQRDLDLVAKLAGGIKSGKNITTEELNKIFEESYDEDLP